MEEKYKDDLKAIKDMMNRSSRFISLDGLSGISVGVIALAGAYTAQQLVYKDLGELSYASIEIPADKMTNLVLVAFGTLILAILAAIFFTTRRAKKQNQGIWDLQTRRLVINLIIPLVTGGLLCLILLGKGFIGFLAPLTLIFHGLALVNASQYTLKEIRGLGLLMIMIGLLAMFFVSSGLILWAMGFGVLHILYGILMEWKPKL